MKLKKKEEKEIMTPANLDRLTYDKDDVLRILRENRDEHRTIFLEALAGYEKRILEELTRRIDDVKNHRPVNLHFNIVVPEDHTKDYNTIISMLERAQDEVISLDITEYSHYIMDDWAWTNNFLNTSSIYGSSNAIRKLSANK